MNEDNLKRQEESIAKQEAMRKGIIIMTTVIYIHLILFSFFFDLDSMLIKLSLYAGFIDNLFSQILNCFLFFIVWG